MNDIRAAFHRLTTSLPGAALVVLLVIIVAHGHTVNDGFYLDDYALARPWSAGQVMDSFSGPFDTSGFNDPYFRPLASVSFAAEWTVWGTNKWGYHLTNIGLHAAASMLLLAVLRQTRLPHWAALVGASYFVVVPSNVATVSYIAERTDAMVTVCAMVALLCTAQLVRTPRPALRIAIVACLVIALLAKEVGVAIIPMVAAMWWYQRLDPDGGRVPVITSWPAELQTARQALARANRQVLALVTPLVVVLGLYLVYRQVVLPRGSLTDRFAETQNPLSSLLGGLNSTVKGVPWEVSAFALPAMAVLIVAAAVVGRRSALWRVGALGVLLMVSGILPLTFSGGVEPRLLYLAQTGMATVVAAAVAVLGEAATAGRRARPPWAAMAVALGTATAALTVWGMTRAQHQFIDGSDKKLDGDERILADTAIHELMPPEYLEEITDRLRAAGRLDG
jgi:hypothetical protein